MTTNSKRTGAAPRLISALRNDRRGIALIMVLWVLAVLMVIVLSFSYMTRTESLAAVSFKEGVEKKFLAEAGIERAAMEVIYRRLHPNVQTDVEGAETWHVDGTLYTVNTDAGHYTVSIIDESGKLNINTLTDASAIILKNLLINAGVEETEANTIVDSILDWKDADDLVRLNGAESDYYMSLPNPYKAKNANFDTLEELLLIKGMTPAILYGEGEKKGVIDFLTVNSNSTQINITAAPREVLMAIPGMTAEVVDSVLSARADPAGLAAIGGLAAVVKAPFNQFVTSGAAGAAFTVVATGYKGEEKGGYTIKATIVIDNNNTTFKYKYYKSPV